MIALLLVDGAGEVAVQGGQLGETGAAEVAPVPGAVPGRPGCDIGRCGTVVVPSDAFRGEDVVGVHLATVLVDLLAVDTGGAVPGLEVQADAGQVCEFVGAPGTFDVLADVDG